VSGPLDFTSALYLGLRHPSRELKPWLQLTTGRPAALAEPPAARDLARRLADLQGCEAGTLGPSTLHLFWDLFGQLAKNHVAIHVDANAYPIARWGAERAAAMGVPVRRFRGEDPRALGRRLERDALWRRRPIILSDGYSPACGGVLPLTTYLDRVRAVGGLLLIDDSQALGVLGRDPGRRAPYGFGGGGSLPWSRIAGDDVIVVSSLAKGFGAPLAVLAGGHDMVARFERNSETRVHCSPPSLAAMSAAEHAMAVNREKGDALRLHLAQLVSRFQRRLVEIGLSAQEGLFPMQTLAAPPGCDASLLHERLLRSGIRAVLHRVGNRQGARISFLITARHRQSDIDRVIEVLEDLTGGRQYEKEVGHEVRIGTR
jgi:8-amino-7-oxononanoate synthase